MSNVEERQERGLEMRRKLLGDTWVDAAMDRAEAHPLGPEFQRMVNSHLFGEIWTRPGAPLRTRLIVVITVLAMRGQARELGNYIRAALDDGMAVHELREVLLQLTAYGGYPVGQGAFSVALDVLDERAAS